MADEKAGKVPVGCTVAMLAAAGLVILLVVVASQDNGEPSGAGRAAAWTMCRFAVEDRLKSPASAKFPWTGVKDFTESLGEGRYRVRAYVDSQNTFGAMARSQFVCEVRISGGEPKVTRLEVR
jgi:hypothetical protein